MTSCSLDAASNSKFSLTLKGSNIPASGSFIVSFDGLNQTIAVTMSSSGGLSSLVEVSKATEIQFGQTYTISSIVERVHGREDERILCSGLTMTTPDGPSLLRVNSATLKVDDLNRVVLRLSFVDMAAGSFVMKVRNTNTLLEFTLSSPIVTTLGSVTGTLTELVYESGKLEYGASYTIVSLESSTLPILIKDTAGFTVPDQPAKINTCSSRLGGEDQNSVILTLGGIGLPLGKEIAVSMKELSGKHLVGSEIAVSWTWDGTGTVSSGEVSVLIYRANPVRLQYGTWYCLTSLVIDDALSVLTPNVTFRVPDEPKRIEEGRVTLNGPKDEATFRLQ
ncbi:hypothetical protein BLNAU_18909 [Blattamonas nauphoetae]|uniref:Lipoprotein n=1 Tax=Blattamonas nauphoetae TaxID=2049346 RepID=A0ABQ9X771_9EUKA|nr:hypothetical protein BLNAU_18909 [Blattamonas nauphoetae]